MVGDIVPKAPSEIVLAFVAHWQSLRAGESVPTSQSFLDNVKPEFQPYVTFNDLSADGANEVALMGTALVELWKVNLTGKKVSEFIDEDQANRLTTDFLLCANQPCGIWEVSTFRTTAGRVIGWEMVTLPLSLQKSDQHRLVRYHHILEPTTKGELIADILHFQKKQWIDTGAGVPKETPLVKAS